ncbi:type II secretion system protein GspK [Serratia sp. L9]|uniref:type II secretion system protein GspK n=1 Tax=Serratia sp. L9 TaxID=3423946 RepID=UPI003D669352
MLAALAEGIDETTARQLLTRRPPAGWDTLAQPLADMPLLAPGRHLLTLNSDYFSLRMVVRLSDTNYRQYSLLQRSNGQARVLRRHWEIEE